VPRMIVAEDIRRLIQFVNRQINRLEKRIQAAAFQREARHAEFNLTSIAVGTQEVDVTWAVPIPSDFAVDVAPPTCAAAFVGLLTASVKAGTKTPTGCTVIVANRSAQVIGAAAFDVLAFPL